MIKWRIWIVTILYIMGIWLAMTSTIFAFKNPSATETERFLHIPRSFILDFKE